MDLVQRKAHIWGLWRGISRSGVIGSCFNRNYTNVAKSGGGRLLYGYGINVNIAAITSFKEESMRCTEQHLNTID
jgi:hypothetical protein